MGCFSKKCILPYVAQDENAIEVATVVHEQFNALGNMRSRGDLSEGIPLVDSELKRRGLHASGVRDTISAGWASCNKSEQQYEEVIHSIPSRARRSDLSTSCSLELYSSMFDKDTKLSIPNLIFLLGQTPPEVTAKSGKRSLDYRKNQVPFVTKAEQLGIPIKSHAETLKTKSEPLFQYEMRHTVPSGFEQINEDLFARKDNKFMVFNGAGVDSWMGKMQPLTRTCRIEDELLHALS